MPSVLVTGSKGGVGTSLLAANLALLLAREGSCVLLDAKPICGVADMLLELPATRSWVDLMPIVEELDPRHLEIASETHRTGLRLLAAPRAPTPADPAPLVPALGSFCNWVVVDSVPGGPTPFAESIRIYDQVILVTTPDRPALRCAARVSRALQALPVNGLALVISQWPTGHPISPQGVADSLSVPLLEVLPPAPSLVANQIELGRPVVARHESMLARAMESIALQLLRDNGRRSSAPQFRTGVGHGSG